MWNEENSQQFVVAVMRVLFRFVSLDYERKPLIKEAHSIAEKAKTFSQAQYDLAFAEALRSLLLADRFEGLGQDLLLDSNLANPLQADLKPEPPVATQEPVEQPKPADDRSNWTVEDWERSGVQFRPAATRVANILQQPEDLRTRKTKATYFNNLLEPPWGVRAVAMVKWAWAQAFPDERLGGLRADEIAHVLSVLYYAGVIKEGSITPVGMGRAKIVRGRGVKS